MNTVLEKAMALILVCAVVGCGSAGHAPAASTPGHSATPSANALSLVSVSRPSGIEILVTLAVTYSGDPPPTRSDDRAYVACEGEHEHDRRFAFRPTPVSVGTTTATVSVLYTETPSIETASLYCSLYQDNTHPRFYTVNLPLTVAWSS